MVIEIKRFIVKKGFADTIIKKFSGDSPIKSMDGFVDFTVMKNMKGGDTEEVMVEIRWASQEAFTKWKQSDAHKAGHSGGQKEKPEFMIEGSSSVYMQV